MKELKELTYILTKNKVQSIEIIGSDSFQHDSKFYQLFEAVRTGKVKNDKEAAKFIYGTNEVTAKYRNLKYNLKSRLINTLFFIDVNGPLRDKAYYNCWKQWSACIILNEKSATYSASKIAEKVINQAIKFEFSNLVVVTSLFLRTYYSLRNHNSVKFEHYNDLYYEYKEIEEYQNLAYEYYIRLILDYTLNSVTIDGDIEKAGKKYISQLEHKKNKINSTRFHYYLFQIQLLCSMGVFDYISAKSICDEALEYLNALKNPFKIGVRNVLLNKLVCHIQLKEFEEGKETALQCENLLDKGAFNWFKAKEYLFMLAMHTGNYQDAYIALNEVTKHSRYSQYKSLFNETWLLNRMYVHFLFLLGEITLAPKDNQFTSIRLGKFINEVPKFSKDKKGMNIPVLIIQLAFLILQKKYDLAIDRIEALEKYCSRYLKRDHPNFRCNYFIRMLLQIPVSSFHKAGVERRAKKYLDKMKTVEINFNSQAHEVEIMPFETMWQFILDALKNKFQR